MHGQLDSVMAKILSAYYDLGLPPLYTLKPEQARAAMKSMSIEFEPLSLYRLEEQLIPTAESEIPIRIYRPTAADDLPVVVMYHGGGWVVCDLDTHDDLARQIAVQACCVVVSVDYRLAPEHKFPSAVEDAYAALCWVAENAENLGVDKNRLAVAGDSAGGNLAAAVTLKAREESGPTIAYQSLWYPVTNVQSLETGSYSAYAEGYRLEKAGMEWFIDMYLHAPADASNPYASPLLADNFSGLPPAYVMTAACDVLRDEGQLYAQALKEAGVSVKYHCFDGLIHGFMNLNRLVPAAQTAVDTVALDLKDRFWGCG